MIYKTNQRADAVLAIVDILYDEETWLRIEPYQNGREHGWSIMGPYSKQVSFSENRNSDATVIYLGKVGQFSMQGNVPNEEIYQTAEYFDYDKLYEAARCIIDYFSKA